MVESKSTRGRRGAVPHPFGMPVAGRSTPGGPTAKREAGVGTRSRAGRAMNAQRTPIGGRVLMGLTILQGIGGLVGMGILLGLAHVKLTPIRSPLQPTFGLVAALMMVTAALPTVRRHYAGGDASLVISKTRFVLPVSDLGSDPG